MIPVVGALLPGTAAATDLESIQSSAESDGRFVRIGLNKSIVIRLPAEAHDVIVGNPEIVDAVVRSKNTAYLFARGIGQTNIFFFDKAGQQILNLDLEVAVDAMALEKLIKRSLPASHIKVEWADKNVVLTGTANAGDAKMAVDIAQNFAGISKSQMGDLGIVNAIKIAGEDQVMLKVRIVEVKRNVLKQFGVNLQALLSVGNFAFNLASIGPLAGATRRKGRLYRWCKQLDWRHPCHGNRRRIENLGGAEPDGHFRPVGQFPRWRRVSDWQQLFRHIDGRKLGDHLRRGIQGIWRFTVIHASRAVGRPHKSADQDRCERAQSTIEVDGIPGIDTRSAETVVELPSGGSMMLAGLIKDTTRQQIDATPGLKKLPVLGALFRSRDYTHDETELVVIVTPYLVGSVAEKQLATPADRLNIADGPPDHSSRSLEQDLRHGRTEPGWCLSRQRRFHCRISVSGDYHVQVSSRVGRFKVELGYVCRHDNNAQCLQQWRIGA